MPAFGARELRAFCRPPMGVPVSFAGVSRYTDDGTPICGIVDEAGQLAMMSGGFGGVVADKPTLRLPYNAFSPMPKYRDIVTVTDPNTPTPTSYSVSAPVPEDDGGFLVYELSATA